MEEKSSILETFLSQNSTKLDKNYLKSKQRLQLLEFNQEGLKQAATEIIEGKLVAFQTETVYGLGADATNEKALVKIFETKQRPFNDPLIVHVSSVDQALKLVEISEEVKQFFLFLSGKFWPGPLTIIMKSDEKIIPNIVTAGTGFVGIRMPKTEVALQLINQSGKPIAAPSANLFTHVSPTEAVHVFNDFYDKELSLLIGGNCQFGIESTVIKISQKLDQKNIEILILRKGSVSASQLEEAVKEFPVGVEIKANGQQNKESSKEAPGQLLKHYAPKIPCFMANVSSGIEREGKVFCSVEKCGVIDFKGVFKEIASELKAYQELSVLGDFSQAMNGLYSALRQFENLEGIEVIIISPIQVEGQNQQFMETLLDKVTRASEGRYAFLRDKKVMLQNVQ